MSTFDLRGALSTWVCLRESASPNAELGVEKRRAEDLFYGRSNIPETQTSPPRGAYFDGQVKEP